MSAFFSNLKRMDWPLNGSVLLLAVMSLITIYSVARDLFWQQFIWFALGLIVIIIFTQIDWRPLINYRWVVFSVYLIGVTLLIVTFFFAPAIRGVRGWLIIGPLRIQAAEMAKLSLIILLSYYFAFRHIGIAQWRNIFISLGYVVLPALLIFLQPDLGSMLVLIGLWAGYLLVSGIRWRHLLIGLIILAVLSSVGWSYFLQDYQKERVIGLFNPDYDPLGVNYNAIQSKIAIGSAGFWGKGFQQGTQVQLGFLPEADSDFIFAAFIEEWGLFGAIVFLTAFTVLLFRIIKIGLIAENNFSKLVCLGTVILFVFHFIINVGSNTGLLPVIGISLPLFSYGGSNLLTNAALIGIIQSIVARRSF